MTEFRHEVDDKPTAFKSFEPVLSRWTADELREAAEHVKQLVNHPGYRVLHRAVKERQDKLLQRLIHGTNVSHETYIAQTSMTSGLDQVLHIAECVQYMAERVDREEAKAARLADRQENAA